MKQRRITCHDEPYGANKQEHVYVNGWHLFLLQMKMTDKRSIFQLILLHPLSKMANEKLRVAER
jgi:hypothetical protein